MSFTFLIPLAGNHLSCSQFVNGGNRGGKEEKVGILNEKGVFPSHASLLAYPKILSPSNWVLFGNKNKRIILWQIGLNCFILNSSCLLQQFVYFIILKLNFNKKKLYYY